MRMRSILAWLALALVVDAPSGAAEPPPPPRLPRDFQWEGRYVVRDLGVEVPFIWRGRDGNLQMIAGGPGVPIHFTNVLVDGQLYTLTYRWPDAVEPPPVPACVCIGRLTLDALNACLATARYVGAETLRDARPRPVHHFRVSVVLGESASKPHPWRFPFMQGDFYVHWADSSKFWRVLHYGAQNLLDPALDEWIVMDTFSDAPGEVTLPAECSGTCRGDGLVLPLFCR